MKAKETEETILTELLALIGRAIGLAFNNFSKPSPPMLRGREHLIRAQLEFTEHQRLIPKDKKD